MVKKRVIPCLDVAGGRVVKGVNFVGLREMGEPIELATRYSELGADELVFLDITATIEGRGPILQLIERAAAELTIPFTVGGGITDLEDARSLLRAGADKVSVNRAAFDDPAILTALAEEFGSQAVVCAIDAKGGEVHTHAGKQARGRSRRSSTVPASCSSRRSTPTAPGPATTCRSRRRSPKQSRCP
jgi:imidazole glycerol-phosphate synthase subunit HisF